MVQLHSTGPFTSTYVNPELARAGDLFYWPPGHTVKVGEDAEVILFSPQHEHGRVLDHILGKMTG